ncbi:uncharacterized protein LOC128125952 [Lactuca sativa]|uniref:uncharacterized protein LOC128125952 n=1 Tax=Lactuca sativa TaxID=4236 RepID=UPI0022AEFE8C|nr:uncharacterized protein LOC128125952 [Lactuca sativa]
MPINTPGTPYSPITPNSPIPITSPSTASSSTGGGAPKRYQLLRDLYENTEENQIPTEELMMIRNNEEPASYTEACKKKRMDKGSCDQSIQNFKKDMSVKFEMSDLGLLTYYLGIEVNQQNTGITLKQEAYAKSILAKTRMLDCNPTKSPMEHKLKLRKDEEGELVNPTEYRSLVGGLRYLTHTRPDITFVVGVVSRFMEKPTIKHLQAVKTILSLLHLMLHKHMGKCAFLNSYKILGKACKETPIDVVNYLVDAMQLHHGKSFLIAPYLQRLLLRIGS